MTRQFRNSMIWVVVLAGMGGVFMLYLQPEMLRAMADQVWACF